MFRHVLIIADIEGSSGCPDYAASAFMIPGWTYACLEMTRDVNAVTTALTQRLLPLGLCLYRLLGIAGITWAKSRLRSL